MSIDRHQEAAGGLHGSVSALLIMEHLKSLQGVGIGHDAHRLASGKQLVAMLIRKKDGGTWSALRIRKQPEGLHGSVSALLIMEHHKSLQGVASATMRIDQYQEAHGRPCSSSRHPRSSGRRMVAFMGRP